MRLKEKEKSLGKIIFTIDNCAFELSKNENSMILGGGLISKMLYDNIDPISIFGFINQMLDK
jgi:hypothetical protein